MQNHQAFIDAACAVIGHDHVLTSDLDMYAQDWRKKYFGRPLAVLRPASTAEVAALVKLCVEHAVAIVPQGGNTGICAGSVPDASGEQVVLNLARLNRLRSVDPANNTMTVEAGCILQTLQDTAESVDRLFPLSLGAEGSCQIGGNISTNAGGVQVLRYGNTRDLVLGLEVVLPSGEILDILRGLRKDNTGYDLKQLFIGAEGTLGIITAATLKLFPAPRACAVAFAALSSPAQAVKLLQHMRAELGERFTAFELMSDASIDLIRCHFPASPNPFTSPHSWYVLMEATDSGTDAALGALFEGALERVLEQGIIDDVALASSKAQAGELWMMRENVSEAQQIDSPNIKHDISLPISSIPAFIDEVVGALEKTYPGVRPIIYGHLGDGNLHFNIARPLAVDNAQWQDETHAVNTMVHDAVVRQRGSISAEHGIGQAKQEEMAHYKSEAELVVMRAIKRAIDPQLLMNPGKVLDMGSTS
ncbi:FAD-binding oxidoreductase [Massilia niastensis]|uniref:FAD-binding oxidoreductase n=1 Tax=Massilia niastensis TaxID=544911 RepID=UPI00036F4442|nr:FAD-binding oxidoreductase [Massilia niastensis]